MNVQVICGLLLVLTMGLPQSTLLAACLDQEPAEVELRGRLYEVLVTSRELTTTIRQLRQKKYEDNSDKHSNDAPNTKYLILRLINTICVDAKVGDPSFSAVKDIKEIQLIIPDEKRQDYRALRGKDVLVKGWLSRSHRGMQYSTVLLIVTDVREID